VFWLRVFLAVLAFVGVGCTREPATLTILHFNDIYEIEPVAGGRAGGLARVATFRRELLRTVPPVLTTLGGDYLSPSAIGTAVVDGQPLAGRQMVAVLNAVGLDWATFGNHEFDLSEAAFRQRLAEPQFRIVSSNVTDANGYPFEGTERSAIVPIRIEGQELRIGLIGVTLDANRKPWVKYLPPIEAARAEIARLRLSGPLDAVVALTHLTLAGDEAFAAAVDDVDVILGGHEHENWILRRGARSTPIVKADANARSVLVVTMTFNGGGRPQVSTRLQLLDERIAQDPAVAAVAEQWRTKAFEAFRAAGFSPEALVASVPEALDGRQATVRNGPGLLTDLIAASLLREVSGPAQIAFFNSGSVWIDDVLAPGPVSQYDVIRILPFGDRVLKATIDGALLIQILDAGLANRGAGGYLQTAGVTHDGQRWLIQDGPPIVPSARYTVALNDFLLTGAEANLGFLVRSNPRVRDVEEFRDVRQALIEELRARYGN
jgi:5'-nucleotidase